MSKRFTVLDFARCKDRGQPIVMLTGYDALFSGLLDDAGVDAILVGDSVESVMAGARTTLGATMEQMIYHGKLVCKGVNRAMVMMDMPFMSYQVSVEQAVRNGGRLLKETGAGSIKLEGGAEVAPAVERLVTAGIPVMGHIGFTPQSFHAVGGNKVYGRTPEAVEKLIEDALALEQAGAFSILIELAIEDVTRQVRDALLIPVIGIGAGRYTDGQLLILHDMLGLNRGFHPKFLKRFANLGDDALTAMKDYASEVRARTYPAPEHGHHE